MPGKRNQGPSSRQTASLRFFRSHLSENDSPLWAYGRPGIHPSGSNSLPGYAGASADVTSHGSYSRPVPIAENVKMERRRTNRVRNTKLSLWNQKLEDGFLAAVSVACLLFSLAVVGVSTWLVLHVRSSENSGQSPLTDSDTDISLEPGVPLRNVSTPLGPFMQRLWDLNTSRLPADMYVVSLQNTTTIGSSHDLAPDSLFSRTATSLDSYSDTYRTFSNLQNDFNAPLRQGDPMTVNKLADIDAFLEAVATTPIMVETHQFLLQQGAVAGNMSDFMDTLHGIWFTPYARSAKSLTLDSSGFEHVFVGETKSNGKVVGFHNWIKFFLEERRRNLDYFGYIASSEPHVISVQFQWLGHLKPVSSFFMGTSPELELAVYTVCLLLRTDQACEFELDSMPVTVISHDVHHLPGLQISSAYPVVH